MNRNGERNSRADEPTEGRRNVFKMYLNHDIKIGRVTGWRETASNNEEYLLQMIPN